MSPLGTGRGILALVGMIAVGADRPGRRRTDGLMTPVR
jgi:hypothetical protein